MLAMVPSAFSRATAPASRWAEIPTPIPPCTTGNNSRPASFKFLNHIRFAFSLSAIRRAGNTMQRAEPADAIAMHYGMACRHDHYWKIRISPGIRFCGALRTLCRRCLILIKLARHLGPWNDKGVSHCCDTPCLAPLEQPRIRSSCEVPRPRWATCESARRLPQTRRWSVPAQWLTCPARRCRQATHGCRPDGPR